MSTNSLPGFTRDGKPATLEAAQDAIDEIRFSRGYIDDRVRSELEHSSSALLRKNHHKLAKDLREEVAMFTKTISDQLYASNSRFIYELLQNADDAAFAPGVEPSITFRITPSCLIVDSNETGFTHANVKAICSTGKSSKVGESDATGEKGFGFKSVFNISHCVHIQSGLWSFEFRHKAHEDGVGMVTPIWTDADPKLSSDSGTRFKLEFSDKSDEFVGKIVTYFEKLPNTLVFALRKIKKVTFILEGVLGRSDKIVFKKHGTFANGEVRITTIVKGRFGDHKNSEAHFRVFQSEKQNMREHELRQKTSSMVTIAFETDVDGHPVIPVHGQYVFAYLPVQRLSQLPFLVQADFILLASREAISENDWNKALLQGVAMTFKKAVVSLCNGSNWRTDPISTRWMRYLPKLPIDGFWEPLRDEIACRLKAAPVYKTRRKAFRTVSDVRALPTWFLYDGEPLLPDTEEDMYLSDCYEVGDVEILKGWGLERLKLKDILMRLKQCLSNEKTNPVHSKNLETDWHTEFTNLLGRLVENSSTKKGLEALKVIPLNNGQWMSPLAARKNPVYLPYIVDEDNVRIELPENLGLNKLHVDAVKVGERREVYTRFEIGTCNSELVKQEIFKAHQEYREGTVDDWRRGFEILFWLEHPFSESDRGAEPHLKACTKEQQLYDVQNIFLPSQKQYNAQQLLAKTPISELKRHGLGFLHPEYMDSKVRNTIRSDIRWLTWLQNRGMSFYPSLATNDLSATSLSPAMKLVAKHNAENFVPALEAHWSEYKNDAVAVAEEVGKLSVPCRDNVFRALAETFVPTEDIVAEARKLKMGSHMPFLKLPDSDLAKDVDRWSFLEIFDVVCKIDCNFYLAVLVLLQDIEMPSSRRAMISTKLYAGIAESSKLGDKKELLKIFEKQSLIYAEEASDGKWLTSKKCVWSGPEFLSNIFVLSVTHGSEPSAASFFKDFLDMRDANHDDVIKELEVLSELRNLDEHQIQQMPEIYATLAEMAIPGPALDKTRKMIVQKSLIYVQEQWLKPSDCLWNCSINISGHVPLQNFYPDLRDFFVTGMRVKTMDANILAHALVEASKTEVPKFDELKTIVIALGQQLSADKGATITNEVLNLLMAATFIPTCGPGGQQLKNVNEDFCINDHERYAKAFFNQITMVDFGYERMTSLHNLFKLLRIEERYLSRKVEVNTIVECSVADEVLTTHFQERAHDLSYLAIYNNSPKYSNRNTDTHNLLVNAEILICDQIRTELTVSQLDPGKRKVKVLSTRAVVKLEVVDGKLYIFVPSDRKGLYSCYCTEMPSLLGAFLGVEGKGAAKIIYRILNDQTQDLSMIMKDEDIPEYSWIEKPAFQHSLRPLTQIADNDSESISYSSSLTIDDEITSETEQIPIQRRSDSLRPIDSLPIWESVSRDQQYKKLLQEIVRQARSVSVSRGGILSLSEIDRALEDLDDPPDYRSFQSLFGRGAPSNPHDRQLIGAAGELFVFERLRSLGVSSFGVNNWQSKLRHLVNVLPGYEDIPRWTESEDADIMYHGDCAILRDFLQQNTSHPYPPWLDSSGPSSIQYHLEVKTTPGPCATPLFLSPKQYKLMKDHANHPSRSKPPQHLYAIIRVYNLDTNNIGMEVYINPWHLKDSVLEFVADPWKVIPLVSE